jgi:flagellar basal body rod protein FlgB
MPLFETPLLSLITKRLQYLDKRAEIITNNISRADVMGAKHRDLKPFEEILNKNKSIKSSSALSSLNLSINKNDVLTHSQNIEKDIEGLELNHITMHQQSIIEVLNTIRKLLKTATSKI